MFNTTSSNFEEETPRKEAANNLIAKEICEENAAHAAENKVLKEQNKIDDLARNEFEKQITDLHFMKERIVAEEKLNKQIEYRQFLLQQIEDKKMSRSKGERASSEVRGNAYTYSEELMTPEVRMNAKHIKQQEMKEALDECIRVKNALKQGEKQMELDEDRARHDFVEKRDMNELLAREQVKQQLETKEHEREEVAVQWNANQYQNDDREQFIDSLLRKDTTLSDMSENDVEGSEEGENDEVDKKRE